MVYHRPPYLVRLPNTVKELLLDMQTKAKQLQWNIMGSQKDVTLTLTWECRPRKLGKTKTRKERNRKGNQLSQEDLSLSDWISDAETTPYKRFSKQLDFVQTLSKLASSISKKPVAGKLAGDISETRVPSTLSPQDIDDGYLTEKATPDEMHVYPKVVVRPPFYLPSNETVINGDEQGIDQETKSVKVPVPVPVPLPPPPPPPERPDKQLKKCNTTEENAYSQDEEDETNHNALQIRISKNLTRQDNFESPTSGEATFGLQDIPETDTEDEKQTDANTWDMSKYSIDHSTDDGNNSYDQLLTPGSDCTDSEIGSAIRFGKYVKFRDSDSETFYGSSPHYDWDLGEPHPLHRDLTDVIHVQELENSPRHKLSYIEPDSTENLNKKKKVKRKNSFQKLFAPLQRKQKYDKKKTQKSPKLSRKLISPKPLYLQKNYVSTSNSVPGDEDTSYSKVVEYQRVKTGKNRQGGDVTPETWDSSLDSHQLHHSVDYCLQSCESILTRQTHAPSDL